MTNMTDRERSQARIKHMTETGGLSHTDATIADEMSEQACSEAMEAYMRVVDSCCPRIRPYVMSQGIIMISATSEHCREMMLALAIAKGGRDAR